MTDSDPQDLGLLAKLVIAVGLLLIVAGILWHGITVAVLQRLWSNIAERPDKPMAFRFILQPLMAATAAILHGLRDARAGRPPYFWTMVRNPQERMGLLREGVNATARILLLGLFMDVIYQGLVLKTFYPNEAVVVALLLAFIPYVIIRGLVVRIAAKWRQAASTHRRKGHRA
jgi:drug/metabolite transporter (DMT)-like permease